MATLLGVNLAMPDHTAFSRRGTDLSFPTSRTRSREPVHIILDSTGLKVYEASDWQTEKHGERARRTWRKLHLAIDPDSGEILASELTSNEVGDPSMVSPLFQQIPGTVASVTADGAYDGAPAYRAMAERQPQPPPAVIIPPRVTAMPSSVINAALSLRDQRIEVIQKKGRQGWEKAVRYGQRSLVETAMFRYKTLIGPCLRARTLPT